MLLTLQNISKTETIFNNSFLHQKQFTDDPALGYTDAGITFVIHSPKEMPRFDGLGLLTPVGMHAQVAIQQLKVSTLTKEWQYQCSLLLVLFWDTTIN